jgi:hypothetical protein
MDLKRITFRVLVCLILAFLLSLPGHFFNLAQAPMHALPGLLSLVLRDGSLIVFLFYLYRRS